VEDGDVDKSGVLTGWAKSDESPILGKPMSSASHFTLAPLLLTCILVEGCGAYFVGFVSNQAGRQTITGTVSLIQLTSFRDITGEMVTATEVTFLNSDRATMIIFCGDQSSKFPSGSQVQVAFNSGVYCSPLVTVVINS
jgi:hypothetical protein